jgi:tetratricopeptide (TPR) repeat protein
LLFGDEATHLLGSARNADLLAVADVGGKVTIWDVSSGRKRWELPVTFPSVQGRTPIHSMAFSLTATSDKSAFRRQRRLQSFAVASDDGVKLWRLGEKPTRETLYSAPIYSLAFALAPEDNGDSKRLEGVDRNGRLLTWIVDDQTIEDEARQRVTKSIQDYECVVYLGKACPGELNDLDHFVEGRALARAGKEKEAIALLSQAAGDGFLNHKTAKQTYNEFRAAALRESARDEQGDLTVQERADHLAHVKSAMEEYKEAFKLDPTVPTTIAIADIAESLASFGKIEEAIEAYNTADELDRTFFDNRANSRYPNNICWSAAMARVDFAKLKKVLPLCEQAVTLEHNAPGPRDSRGIVRALTGDIRGALDDETAFMNWTGKQWDQDRRRDWINCIQIQGPSHAEVCNATLIDALRHRYGAPPR